MAELKEIKKKRRIKTNFENSGYEVPLVSIECPCCHRKWYTSLGAKLDCIVCGCRIYVPHLVKVK